MSKSLLEKKIIIRMRRLAKKKALRDEMWKEQDANIKEGKDINYAMKETIAEAGYQAWKENNEKKKERLRS